MSLRLQTFISVQINLFMFKYSFLFSHCCNEWIPSVVGVNFIQMCPAVINFNLLALSFSTQPIDYEGFHLFMATYLENDIPEELCQHLFTSFKSKTGGCSPNQSRAGTSLLGTLPVTGRVGHNSWLFMLSDQTLTGSCCLAHGFMTEVHWLFSCADLNLPRVLLQQLHDTVFIIW